MTVHRRRLLLLIAAGVAVGILAVPVLAASPAPSNPPGQEKQKDKGPESTVTVTGTVAKTADGYTVTSAGKTWELSAGPAWFWGDKNPLSTFVGKSVTVVGTHRGTDLEIDVETVNGKTLREPGKPPWAGGPFVVGKSHPGWHDWMADGKPGKGPANAPGQQRKASPAP